MRLLCKTPQYVSLVLIVSIITPSSAQFSSLTGANRKKLTLKNFSDGKNGGQNGFMGAQQGGVDYVEMEPPPKSFEHRNAETQLIDNLFSGYNPNARPVKDFNQKVHLNFSIQLKQILKMDLKEQQLTTALWMNYAWFDDYLVWNPEEWGGVTDIRVEIDQVWKPDLLLYNSISDSFDSNYPSKAVIDNKGKVLWIPPAIVQSACSVDVQFFPFDEQKCDLSYGPWTHDFSRMDVHNTFMIDDRPSGDLTYLVPNGEWNVTSFWATREEVDFGLDNPYVFLTYKLHLKRYHKSGIMNYLLPCLTVSILAILVFILPPDAGEKIGLAITTLLTLVVFLQMLGDATPATPDGAPTPVITSFFIYTLCMVTASCALSVIILYFNHRNVGLQKPMGHWFRAIFLHYMPMIIRMAPPGEDRPPVFGSRYRAPREKDAGDVSRDEICVDSRAEEVKALNNGWNDNGVCENKREYVSSPEAHALLTIGREMVTELQKLTQKLTDDNEEAEQQDEWVFASIILDRCCLYLFSIYVIFVTIFTIGQVPQLLFH